MQTLHELQEMAIGRPEPVRKVTHEQEIRRQVAVVAEGRAACGLGWLKEEPADFIPRFSEGTEYGCALLLPGQADQQRTVNG